MIGWTAVLSACLACFALKLAGHLAPRGWLERPATLRLAAAGTAALLAALVAVQTVADGGAALRLDARLAAIGVAALALWRRAPFLVVVLLAAGTAALARAAGLGG